MTAAPQLSFVADLKGSDNDALVVVLSSLDEDFPGKEVANSAASVDKKVGQIVTIHYEPSVPGSRLILAPTGKLNRDTDDVRHFATAARGGILRASQAGAKAPLIYFASKPALPGYEKAVEVALLGVYQELYVGLQAREHDSTLETVQKIGFHASWIKEEEAAELSKRIYAVETGRRLARDLGGSDPERMAPPKFADYVVAAFKPFEGIVKVTVLHDQDYLAEKYPLLHSVGRAALHVDRHHSRVVRLEYTGESEITESLLLAGKGVTYDTGGADVKVGGSMHGMCKDKCGASNVAGFVLATALLRPKNVKIVAELGVVRNSIGSNSYVADEIIKGYSGQRVRVVNTDAEGRMVLADCLAHLLKRAKTLPNPKMMSFATLTGHVIQSWGCYTALIPNGAAKRDRLPFKLQETGEAWGDSIEVSSYRKEDLAASSDVLYDVIQHQTGKPRGHQYGAGFLIAASGLSKHGLDSEQPIPYMHVDIAASAAENSDYKDGKPTGCTIAALTAHFL